MGNLIGNAQVLPQPLSQKLTIVESARRMQAGQPVESNAQQPDAKPATKLHPWLQNTLVGTAIGTIAGSGTALAVSHFLDDPLVGIHKAKIGGIQGAVSGSVGALAAYWTPNRTTGTVVGGLAGAGSAVVQALGTGTTNKLGLITSAIIGLAAGAAAGNISVMVRDKHQAHQAKVNQDQEDEKLVPGSDP